MTEPQAATAIIAASPTKVRAALTDAPNLPDWNPAFRRVTGPTEPTVGAPYSLSVRGGLSGHFTYTRIEPRRVDATWEVPGFRETATWTLQPHGSGTMVGHSFQHSGPLAALLTRSYVGVAHVRLDRLAQHVG
jgi:uncharacterized protein YndB with AHSA1/START domain